jgi:hypothetical protein
MNQDLFILYKLATRSRPERFSETIDSITKNSNSSNYLVLASIDEDDELMQKYIEDRELGLGYPHPNVVVVNGRSKNKIDAINRDIDKVISDWNIKWDILVNISDDMLITSNQFDVVVRSAFAETTDLFLHLPDGYVNEILPTMSIMGFDYYKRFGYIYHPSYESVYCDNEAMDVAKMLNKHVYIDLKLFTHNHPANVGRHLWDAQYERTESQDAHTKDCLNYNQRKSLLFI